MHVLVRDLSGLEYAIEDYEILCVKTVSRGKWYFRVFIAAFIVELLTTIVLSLYVYNVTNPVSSSVASIVLVAFYLDLLMYAMHSVLFRMFMASMIDSIKALVDVYRFIRIVDEGYSVPEIIDSGVVDSVLVYPFRFLVYLVVAVLLYSIIIPLNVYGIFYGVTWYSLAANILLLFYIPPALLMAITSYRFYMIVRGYHGIKYAGYLAVLLSTYYMAGLLRVAMCGSVLLDVIYLVVIIAYIVYLGKTIEEYKGKTVDDIISFINMIEKLESRDKEYLEV